jgi:hypothetical protein
MINVISLGAGVQSTTLALLAAHGEITPMPDAAIFADTGWEPQAVYDHLAWLSSPNVLPFPVIRVGNGNIRTDLLKNAAGLVANKRSATPPLFVHGSDGREAMLHRQCTDAYKLDPILKELRRMVGLAHRQRAPKHPVATVWIGISRDEAHRAKPSMLPWIARRFPLLDLLMRRWDCLQWLDRHGYPRPPKSACIGCPYHSADGWRALTVAEMDDAIFVDEAIRDGLRGTDGPLYLHRSLKPLASVDFTAEPDLFGEECEGVCGV